MGAAGTPFAWTARAKKDSTSKTSGRGAHGI